MIYSIIKYYTIYIILDKNTFSQPIISIFKKIARNVVVSKKLKFFTNVYLEKYTRYFNI